MFARLAPVFLRLTSTSARSSPPTLLFALGTAVAHLSLGGVAGPYAVGHSSRGSFEEIVDLTKIPLVGILGLVVNVLLPTQLVPRSIPLAAALVAVGAMLAMRMTQRARTRNEATDQRVTVFDAGESGRQLVRTMLNNPKAGLMPVALVHDDPAKYRLSNDGIRGRGTRVDIKRLADQTNASTLAVAVPSADSAARRDS